MALAAHGCGLWGFAGDGGGLCAGCSARVCVSRRGVRRNGGVARGGRCGQGMRSGKECGTKPQGPHAATPKHARSLRALCLARVSWRQIMKGKKIRMDMPFAALYWMIATQRRQAA